MDKRNIQVTGSSNNQDGENTVTISGLTHDEAEALKGLAAAGTNWVTVREGRLVIIPAIQGFPDPIRDEEMHPYWRGATEEERNAPIQQILIDEDSLTEHSSPSIFISSICAYSYTPENYESAAEKLLSYGFDIMRSPRGTDGRYWEQWYLSGLWSAKGSLKTTIERCKNEDDDSEKATELQKLRAAMNFLAQNIQFGTLDVCVQRMATVIND